MTPKFRVWGKHDDEFGIFLIGFVGAYILTVLLLCSLIISDFQNQLLEIQERVEQVSSHLGYVEDRLNNPEIVYQVDSYGGTWHGKITDKEIKNDRYGVEIGSYGWFLVTKEQYEALNIGDDAPEFLTKRGS